MEQLGILRDDQTNIAKRFGPEADGRGVGSADDVVEQRLIEARKRAGMGELESNAVDGGLLVVGAVKGC